jgi:hypothetical protein
VTADLAVVGREGGGVGNRSSRQPRDPSARAKKNGMSQRKIQYGVIPPKANSEFVASMEEVLDTYAEAVRQTFSGVVHG